MRTISTLAAVGMVGVLYVGNVVSDDAGPVGAAQTPVSEQRAIILSECMEDGRFAEVELEVNADGVPVIAGLDPDLSPDEAADLIRGIQECIVAEP